MTMDGTPGGGSGERGVGFVPVRGSIIGGMPKTKTARIRDGMADLQLGIDGLRSQLAPATDGGRWADGLAAFARTCSVFLRKTVLGDYGKRERRLLDDRVVDETGLRFDPLRRIARNERRTIECGFGVAGGYLKATKLDGITREPEATYGFRAGAQGVELSIEWPLPGAADWTGVPSEESPWPISPEQLFRKGAGPAMSCDDWLGQQVVLFDGKGISLREMIRTVVNFEGAHSIDVGRLAMVEGERKSRAAANPAPHILNAVSFCGVRYAHLVVIESALYLYEKLLGAGSIERPGGDIYTVTPAVACSPEQAASVRPDWVRFQGGMMVSFSPAPRMIRHRIRATG